MKTNHRRNFVAVDDAPRPDNSNWNTRMHRKLQSGKPGHVKAMHVIIHNGNRGISKTLHDQKRSLNRLDRRDGKVVIQQQLGEVCDG